MKLLIVLAFCLGFVVCRDTLWINYPPSVPLDSESAHSAPLEQLPPPSPSIHVSGPEVPLSEYIDFITEESEEEPKKKTQVKKKFR